jgi:hypothetical protein
MLRENHLFEDTSHFEGMFFYQNKKEVVLYQDVPLSYSELNQAVTITGVWRIVSINDLITEE